jgi:hypothetical protein
MPMRLPRPHLLPRRLNPDHPEAVPAELLRRIERVSYLPISLRRRGGEIASDAPEPVLTVISVSLLDGFRLLLVYT